MARSFTKNTANDLSFGTAAIGPLIDGAGAISVAAWVVPRTFSTTTVNDNSIFHAMRESGGSNLTSVRLCCDALTAGGPYLRVGGRCANGDSFQAVNSLATLCVGGWNHVGGVFDYAGDAITPYVGGKTQGRSVVSFGGNAYAHTVSTFDYDRVGAAGTPLATSSQFDGDIAEVAVWKTDIGAEGFARLAAGASPRDVSPSSLVFYMRLDGLESPEQDIIGGKLGTITGSIPAAQHPYIDTADGADWLLRLLSGGGAFTLAADPGVLSITASAATLKAARRITGAAASYTLTVGDATLIYDAAGSATLAADAASYAVTGSAVALRADRRLSSAAASFAITASAAGLTVARRLTGAAGAFTLTGDPATLTYSGEAVTIPAGPTLHLASHNRRLVLPAQRRTLRIAA